MVDVGKIQCEHLAIARQEVPMIVTRQVGRCKTGARAGMRLKLDTAGEFGGGFIHRL
jgi:hypothetical protein